ncbi:hypothetical protein FPV67DRAFT_1415201, partial [Lyophyllum atratum]
MPSPTRVIERLSKENEGLRKKAKEATQKYWNVRRRGARMEKAAAGRKIDLKQAKIDAVRLRGVVNMLGKDLKDVKDAADETTSLLRTRIKGLIEVQKDLTHRRIILGKRCRRLEVEKRRLKERMREQAKKHPATFRMMHKGRYTPAARSLARLMVSTGTAEAKVGSALVEIGNTLGITVDKHLDKRSVQRFMLEQGVAADIQLVYEIIKAAKITYSSDSTSHRHIEYECRTIALQVVDYSNPSAKPEWKSRTLGIGTSINHASQTQVDGLKQRLQELAEVFNNSALAKREGLRFIPDDFAFRLIGTSGDHAAD